MLRLRVLSGGRDDRLLLASIMVVATALRVLSALYQGDTLASLPGVEDQFSYDMLARRVLAGAGFSFPVGWWPVTRAGEPTAHWSFLYTLYLALAYTLFGEHPLAARLIQAALGGILQVWLTWRLGTRIFDTRVGLAAGAITAVYAYFVYYAGALMTETFYIVAVLGTIDLATWICQAEVKRPRSGPKSSIPWLLLGLALGVAVLLRQVILLLVPLLFAWLIWAITKQKPSSQDADTDYQRSLVVSLLTTVLILGVMIAPWTARNYQAFGRFVLLNTNAGYAFFFANHEIHGTDFVPILPSPVYRELIPVELRGLDEAALDQALLMKGLTLVAQNPLRYAQLSLSRIPEYFVFWPSPDSGTISNIARVFSFGIMLPFALYGLFLSIAHRQQYVRDGQRDKVALLYLFMAFYSLIHISSWSLIRYRLPVDAVLLLFAALALTDIACRGWALAVSATRK